MHAFGGVTFRKIVDTKSMAYPHLDEPQSLQVRHPS
jgi:hypothetical protein